MTVSDDPLWAPTVPVPPEEAVTTARDDSPNAVAVDPDPTPVGEVVVVPAEAAGRRRRPVLYTIVGLLLAGVLLIGYYAVSLYQVWSTGRSDEARTVDAIVVLGAAQYDGRPSPQLQARLDQVLRLWPESHAPMVIVTGGRQPGDRFTEAGSSAIYLIDRGVPPDAIVQEDQGASTYESLEAVATMLDERGLGSVLIVTDPYHALRSRLIAEEVGLEAYVSPTTTSVVTGAASVKRHVREAAGVALGRLIGFERLSGRGG